MPAWRRDRELGWFFPAGGLAPRLTWECLPSSSGSSRSTAWSELSAGSLAGLFHTLGYTSAEMTALVKKELGPGLMRFLPGGAYLNTLRLMRGRLASRLLRYVPHSVRLEDFSHPRLLVTCTDLVTKRCVVLDHGSAADAVVASCGLPGVATPVLNGPMVLVDGGVVDNCPCQVLCGRNLDLIVAVNASGVRRTAIRPGCAAVS